MKKGRTKKVNKMMAITANNINNKNGFFILRWFFSVTEMKWEACAVYMNVCISKKKCG